jgi:hypothetical protein
MALLFEVLNQLFLKFETGMIAAYSYFHDRRYLSLKIGISARLSKPSAVNRLP